MAASSKLMHQAFGTLPCATVTTLKCSIEEHAHLFEGGADKPTLCVHPSGAPAASGWWRSARLGAALSGSHRHPSAPARSRGKKGDHDQALGRSRGGFSTKIHLRAEGGGKPMVLVLTPGQRHEQSAFEALMEQGAEQRQDQGLFAAASHRGRHPSSES